MRWGLALGAVTTLGAAATLPARPAAASMSVSRAKRKTFEVADQGIVRWTWRFTR